MVAEKIFCMTGAQGGVSIKVLPEEFEAMTERNGVIQTPYMARNMWVTVQQFNNLRPKEWEHYLLQSYELVRSKLTKKVQATLR